jgi:hypothetical protein
MAGPQGLTCKARMRLYRGFGATEIWGGYVTIQAGLPSSLNVRITAPCPIKANDFSNVCKRSVASSPRSISEMAVCHSWKRRMRPSDYPTPESQVSVVPPIY